MYFFETSKDYLSRQISIKYYDNIEISIKWQYWIMVCLFGYDMKSESFNFYFDREIYIKWQYGLHVFRYDLKSESSK